MLTAFEGLSRMPGRLARPVLRGGGCGDACPLTRLWQVFWRIKLQKLANYFAVAPNVHKPKYLNSAGINAARAN
jgi:hypothetical protein